jgi:hypothetical protein
VRSGKVESQPLLVHANMESRNNPGVRQRMPITSRTSYLRKGLSQRIYKWMFSIWVMIRETELERLN